MAPYKIPYKLSNVRVLAGTVQFADYPLDPIGVDETFFWFSGESMLLAAKQLQSHQSPVTPGSFFILRKIRPLLYSHAQSLKLVKAHKPGHIDIRKLHHFLILRLQSRPTRPSEHQGFIKLLQVLGLSISSVSNKQCLLQTCCCASCTGSARRQWFRLPSRRAACYPSTTTAIMHSLRHFNKFAQILTPMP